MAVASECNLTNCSQCKRSPPRIEVHSPLLDSDACLTLDLWNFIPCP